MQKKFSTCKFVAQKFFKKSFFSQIFLIFLSKFGKKFNVERKKMRI
jgi:hypothetical protein